MAEIKGYCAHCKSKCGSIATVEDGRLTAVRADRDHPNNGFCVKGVAAPEVVHNAGRIRTPMKRTNPKSAKDPGFVPISWEEALATISSRLLQIKAESGAEAVVFGRPAPGGSQANDWAPFFERLSRGFGSPNVITTSHICQWGREAGSIYTFGTGMPTPHFEASKTILIWGHNPASAHIQNWRRIHDGQRNGAKLIVVDPRRTVTASKADLWVQLRPGSDAALALGLVHILLRDRLFDLDFVKHWTNAAFLVSPITRELLRGRDIGAAEADHYVVFDSKTRKAATIDVSKDPAEWGIDPALEVDTELELTGHGRVRVRSAFALLAERVAAQTPEQTSLSTDVPVATIEELARAIGSQGPLSYYTYNGVEQHIDTAQINRALCILYGLTGWIDAEGGNVSFAEIPAPGIGGNDLLGKAQAAKRLGLAQRPLSAARRTVQAYNFYAAALGEGPYRARALVMFGGNLLLQNGDAAKGRRALEALDFQVHADLFPNPSSETADILLPTTTPWEAPFLCTGFDGGPTTLSYVQYRPAALPPQHESRTDLQLILDLAVALGMGEHFWQGNVEEAFRFTLSQSGLTLEDVKAHPGGINVEIRQTYKKYRNKNAAGVVQGLKTRSRKLEIYAQEFLDHGYDPLPSVLGRLSHGEEFPLILTSHKLPQYCHSQGRGIPKLRAEAPVPYLEIHPATARDFQIVSGEVVAVKTMAGEIRLEARVTDEVAPGVVATQTGWWEACEELGLPGQDPLSGNGANVNFIMTNDALDPISGSVPVKAYPCTLRRIATQTGASQNEQKAVAIS